MHVLWLLLKLVGFVLAVAAAAVMYLHYMHYLKAPKYGKRIPGPPQTPLLGNVPQILEHVVNPNELYLKWIQQYVRGV